MVGTEQKININKLITYFEIAMCLITLTKDVQICLKKIKKGKWNRHEGGRVGEKRSYI